MIKIDLLTMHSGAVIDMFNEEYKKVLANIGDDNVKPNAAREIDIKVLIKPDKTRRTAQTEVNVTSKLAPVKSSEKVCFFDEDDEGNVVAFEDNVKQLELDGMEDAGKGTIYKMSAAAAAAGSK
jgi:hypothetical protein